jgi:hypothetical protein
MTTLPHGHIHQMAHALIVDAVHHAETGQPLEDGLLQDTWQLSRQELMLALYCVLGTTSTIIERLTLEGVDTDTLLRDIGLVIAERT